MAARKRKGQRRGASHAGQAEEQASRSPARLAERTLGVWRRVYLRTWADEKFRSLDDPTRLLWLYLLTGPHTTSVPGLFIATEMGLAGSMRWPHETLRERFRELVQLGMLRHDADAALVWLPRAIHYELPANPNVIKSWRSHLAILPECDLLQAACSGLSAAINPLGPTFEGALRQLLTERFGKPFGEPYGEPGSRIQDAGVSPHSPPAGGSPHVVTTATSDGPAAKAKSSRSRRKSGWEGDLPWDSIVQTWNENAGALPRLTIGAAPSTKRETLARHLWLNLSRRAEAEAGAHDDDYALGLLGAGVRRCSGDGHYVQNRHGFDAFCRHADRWLDTPGQATVFDPAIYRPEDYPEGHHFHTMWAQS